MTIDDIRRKFPALGIAIYAFEPGQNVTLEVMSPDGTIFTFKGPTEQAALGMAFPEEPEPEAPAENVFD